MAKYKDKKLNEEVASGGVTSYNDLTDKPDLSSLHTQNTDTGTTGNTFVIDSDSTTGKITLDVTLNAGQDRNMTITNEPMTADRTITLPNATGTVALTSGIPEKATGAELNNQSDDAKFATAKALADSDYLNILSLPSLSSIETLDSEAHYLWLYDSNDGLLKQCPISILKAYLDTLYTPL